MSAREALRRAVPFALATLALASPAAAASADEAAFVPPRRAPITVMASGFLGMGLRFNNPYRLPTPLGSTAESVSRTSGYVDVGAAGLYGRAGKAELGLALRASFALEGVQQAVLVPAAMGLWRTPRVGAYARAGVPIVLTPDTTWGLEGGLGGLLFLTGGVALAAEIVGDVIWGAGTWERKTTTYPILSAQMGIVVAYEVLP